MVDFFPQPKKPKKQTQSKTVQNRAQARIYHIWFFLKDKILFTTNKRQFSSSATLKTLTQIRLKYPLPRRKVFQHD